MEQLHQKHTGRLRSGQSMIESCLVIGLMCVLFLGVVQLSQILAAQEFLNYAAGRGARAKTVGFNDFMVYKTMRVGSIPNAGRMISPAFTRSPATWGTDTSREMWQAWTAFIRAAPRSEQYDVEQTRIPLYLGAQWYGQLRPILDYENWDSIHLYDASENDLTGTLTVRVRQDYPLNIPLHHAFYAGDSVRLDGVANLENHYTLYLTDWGQ